MFIQLENSWAETWYLLLNVVLWRNSVGCSDFCPSHVAITTLAVCLCINPLFGVDWYTAFFRISVLSESFLLKASMVRNLSSTCRDWEAVELLWVRLRRRLFSSASVWEQWNSHLDFEFLITRCTALLCATCPSHYTDVSKSLAAQHTQKLV